MRFLDDVRALANVGLENLQHRLLDQREHDRKRTQPQDAHGKREYLLRRGDGTLLGQLLPDEDLSDRVERERVRELHRLGDHRDHPDKHDIQERKEHLGKKNARVRRE